MNQTRALSQKQSFGALAAKCRTAVISQLESLQDGQITIHEQGQHWICGAPSALHVDLRISDENAWVEIALGGSIGAAESYMRGEWQSNHLTALIQIFARNLPALDKIESSQRWLTNAVRKLLHAWHSNTRKGSRANIAKHYDLGNDMFKLWLDPLMMYSGAIYPSETATLAQASEYKLQRIAEKLAITADDHVLEIGTGWGGLSIFLASRYGCKVTTTTISRQQYEEVKARVEAHGLQDKITLLLKDYRELDGTYDKLVSIEMIEAVGLNYLPTYFKQCNRLLKPSGAFLLQSITIADQRYEYAAKNVDFIQKYIFPGGSLPSNTRIAECVRDHTDMLMVHHEDIGQDYAKTLHAWHQNFTQQKSAIHALGYDEVFTRMWHYYLSYCEGAFLEKAISCAQIVLHKKQCNNTVR